MAGRKGEKWWRDAVRVAICEKVEGDDRGRTKLRAVADKLVECAMEGDIQAIKEIGDRLDGKAIQSIEGTGASGEIITRIILEAAGNDDSAD